MNLRCLDKKRRQKNQAKNILPPHVLTHARIFVLFIYIYFYGHSLTSFLGLAFQRTLTRNFPVKQNYVSLQLCDGMSEMRAATRNDRGSIFLT